jgi:hypothetical protein
MARRLGVRAGGRTAGISASAWRNPLGPVGNWIAKYEFLLRIVSLSGNALTVADVLCYGA